MAQHDYVIANGTGAAVRSDLNNALAAIVSQNSGATEPATMYAYQWWADTTTGLLKLRNAANNAWITLRELDGTLTIEAGTVSAPGLAFASDLNTGIYSPSADQLAIATNGVERVEFGTSEVVFNDGGTNYDFRIEGDTNANLFFVDASADAVGLGTSSPGYRLTVVDNSSGVQGRFESSSTSGTTLGFVNTATNGRNYRIGSNYVTGNGEFAIYDDTAAASRLFINSSGSVGIGTTGPTQRFQVTDGTLSNFFVAPGYNSGQGTTLAVGGGEYIEFATNGITNPRARIDSSGRLLVGTSSARSNFFNTTISPLLQIEGASSSSANSGRFISHVFGRNADSEPVFAFGKHRSESIGGTTVVQSGDYLGTVSFQGSDGTEFVEGASISAVVDTTPGANDMPGRLVFSTTADGASGPTERMRIDNAGLLFSTPTYNDTTTNAANVVIASTGRFSRSTSSIKYKTDVETLSDSYANAVLQCRPVWYRSLSSNDNPAWGYWGFIAEEVAEIDPRLVSWKTVETSHDENGSVVETPCDPEPEGVQYDRFVPHLLNLIKRQGEAIAELQAEVAALKGA
jgi:hypothetical protein